MQGQITGLNEDSKARFHEMIAQAESIAVLGHTDPDGDCISAVLAMGMYIEAACSGKQVSLFLEKKESEFSYLDRFSEIQTDVQEPKEHFDLCICVDCAGEKRLGRFLPILKAAEDSICIDHHVTNPGYTEYTIVEAGAAAACEILTMLFKEEYIDSHIADALYTGIVYDTKAFRMAISDVTLNAAGLLLRQGADHSRVVEDGFYAKGFHVMKLRGIALSRMESYLNGRVVAAKIGYADGARSKNDIRGITESMRDITGSEIIALFYEETANNYKVQLRSKDATDVSKLAEHFGGGGHEDAAGYQTQGSYEDNLRLLLDQIQSEGSGIR